MSADSRKPSKPFRRSGLSQGTPKIAVQLPEKVRQALERRASDQRTTTARLIIEILTEQLEEEIRAIAQEEKQD